MSIPILSNRKFGTHDAEMIQFCSTTRANLSTYLASFTAFDAQFNAPYVLAFGDAIDTAQNFVTDDQFIDIMAQYTMDVEAQMVICRDAFATIKYFVTKAFPNRPGVWNEFGFNDYENCRKNHEKMIQFMSNLHASADKYSSELSLANYPATGVADLLLLKNTLQEINTTQETSKGARTDATNQRIQLLNTAYDICMHICNAGKIIFAADYGKYQLFVLPWGGGGGEASNTIDDTIIGSEVKNMLIAGLNAATELTLTNLGNFDLHFYFADTAIAPTGNTALLVGPGATQIVAAANIGFDPSHTFLNLIMPTGISCDYRVEWI